MVRRSFVILITVLVFAALGGAIPGMAEQTGNRWQVTANGSEGLLELTTHPGGRISGTLLGKSVEGWLVGRHLVLIRDSESGPETWEAWLATSENVQNDGYPVLAGTLIKPGGDGPLPWFGISNFEAAEANDPALPPPATVAVTTATAAAVSQRDQLPEDPTEATEPPTTAPAPGAPTEVQQQVNVVTPEQPPVPPAGATVALLPSGKPSLAGTWDTPDGPLTIRQNGSSLTFVLPDREVSGRLTGVENLIGGFGPGCCKGLLEQAAAVITWDNGVRWQRQ